jgi:hypothetical protein
VLFDGPVLRAEWQPISGNNTQLYHQRKLASERYGYCSYRCPSSCDSNGWSFCSNNGPNAQAVYIVGGKNSLKRRRSWRASLHSNSMWRNCSQNIPSILFSFFLSPVAGYYRRGYIFAFPPRVACYNSLSHCSNKMGWNRIQLALQKEEKRNWTVSLAFDLSTCRPFLNRSDELRATARSQAVMHSVKNGIMQSYIQTLLRICRSGYNTTA